MGIVVPLHETREAKAQGIFAQINIAARRLGYSPLAALRAARKARSCYLEGGQSPAHVVSVARADLRHQADPEVA